MSVFKFYVCRRLMIKVIKMMQGMWNNYLALPNVYDEVIKDVGLHDWRHGRSSHEDWILY